MSADTVVPGVGSQALNRYAYVLGNPLRFIDPTGHKADTPPVGCEHSPQCLAWWRESIVKFRGNWPAAYRAAVADGAWAVANRLAQAVSEHQAMRMGLPESARPYVYPHLPDLSALEGLSPRETFQAVYGEVTFHRIEGNPITGWAEAHLDWANNLCDVGEICYDDSMFDAAANEFQVKQNVGHELGHGIDQRGGRQARADLAAAWDDLPLRRNEGGFAGRGWEQNTGPEPGEVFADMVLGWTYGQWDYSVPAGIARSRYMETNMPRWIALAVAGN